MHISPHLNHAICSTIMTRIVVTSQSPEINPHALEVERWMERNSPLCQSVMDCLRYRGVPDYYRKDLTCKRLRALFSVLQYPADREPHRDEHIIRFDRLAALYCRSNGSEQQEIDRLFICLLRVTLPELLESHPVPDEPDLSGLKLRNTDYGFGEEQEAFCEYNQAWVPVHLIPYRFALSRGTESWVADLTSSPTSPC